MTTVLPANDAAQEALAKSEEILRHLDSMTSAPESGSVDAQSAREASRGPDELLELLEKTKVAYLKKLAEITAQIKNAQIAKLEASLKS